MSRKEKKIIISILILSMIFITGCWDMVDVEQRIYPYTVGYDLLPEESEETYDITISHPNLEALGKNPVSDEKIHIASIEADNLFDAIYKLSTRVQYPFSLKHLKVILLTEKMAENENLVRETMDGINRDFLANKNAEMLITRGSASELLNGIGEKHKLMSVEGVLNGLLMNTQKSTHFTPKSATDFIEDMDVCGGSIIPIVKEGNDLMSISGGAIFKDYKLLGYVDDMIIRDIAYLTDQVAEDGYSTLYNGADLSLMITNTNTKKELISKTGNIKMKLDVEIESHIHSYMLAEDRHIETKEMLESMEDQVAKEAKESLEKTIEILQQEYRVDLLQIGDHIHKFHPKLWKEIEKDWEEIYPDVDIEVDVKVDIRRRGLTK